MVVVSLLMLATQKRERKAATTNSSFYCCSCCYFPCSYYSHSCFYFDFFARRTVAATYACDGHGMYIKDRCTDFCSVLDRESIRQLYKTRVTQFKLFLIEFSPKFSNKTDLIIEIRKWFSSDFSFLNWNRAWMQFFMGSTFKQLRLEHNIISVNNQRVFNANYFWSPTK